MARNSKVSLVLAGIVFLLTILSGVANAGVTPSIFATQKSCESVVLAGEGAYKFYVPKYLGGSKKDPIDGTTKVVAPLEAVACVQMDTTAGKKWVAQAEGTEFRFNKKADGSLEDVPYARNDCGNMVYGISYPTSEVSVPERKAVAEAPRPGYQVGDPCMAFTPDGKPAQGAITQVFTDGGASCDAIVEIPVPSKGKAFAQYLVCTTAGAVVGYQRSGASGAFSGAAAGASGTYLGREFGGENWGWVGCVTGPAVGLIKWGKGGAKKPSPIGGGPVNPPLGPVSPLVGGPVNPPLW